MVLVAVLSPRFHDRFSGAVPVDVSVNVTVNGSTPLLGMAVKLAVGATAPVPVTVFVEFPPLLVKITTLVNPPVDGGAKLTVTV